MKYFAFFILLVLSLHSTASPATVIIPGANYTKLVSNTNTFPDSLSRYMLSLTPRDITRLTGKKLTLKEKLAWSIVKHRLRKQATHPDDAKPSKDGQTAFILGLLSLIVLVIPYVTLAALPLAIIAIIIGSKAKKKDPNDHKARTGITLGLVTLGLIVLAFVIVLAVLAGGGFWW